MRKKHRSQPHPHPVSRMEQRRFQGNISTIFYNVAIAIIYAVFLNVTLDDTTGTIAFFVLAVLQMVVCVILAVNYNSKMWLFSGLAVFLISCGMLIYINR
ncbi:MAG: hypothetical protein V4577_08510 [Bacteroidota bacterium]